MGASPTNPRRLEAAERRAQALALRKAGATQQQIGQQLGVTHQAVSKMLHAELAALKGLAETEAEIVRQLELERLDALLVGLWPRARGGDCAAVDRVLRIMERRAALLGLDAPKGLALNVTDDRPIDERSTEELLRLAAEFETQAKGDPKPSTSGSEQE